jgi:hypothetical protein
MVELEQQIAAWVDDQLVEVAPVTADEVVAARPPSRRQHLLAIAAVVLAIATVAAVVTSGGDDAPVVTDDGGDWVTSELPGIGWEIDHPPGWTTEWWTISDCATDEAGAIITNRPLSAREDRCGRTFDRDELEQPGFVGLRVTRRGPDVIRSEGAEPRDDVLPLALDDAGAGPGYGLRPGVVAAQSRSVQVTYGGDAGYTVTGWLGAGATAAQVTMLRRMVASIWWPDAQLERLAAEPFPATNGLVPASIPECARAAGIRTAVMITDPDPTSGEPRAQLAWPDESFQDRTLRRTRQRCAQEASDAADRVFDPIELWSWRGSTAPSQTSAEAERDGVSADLAELALSDRSLPSIAVHAAEGTWAASSVPNVTPCLGAGCETYAELLLVDDDQRLRLAVPMSGFAPTWMVLTTKFLYAGQDADEVRGDTAIARIDRETHEVEIVAFDPPRGLPTTGVPLSMRIPNGWRTSRADPSPLVTQGTTGDGMLASSGSGSPQRVDLDAIETLFE